MQFRSLVEVSAVDSNCSEVQTVSAVHVRSETSIEFCSVGGTDSYSELEHISRGAHTESVVVAAGFVT